MDNADGETGCNGMHHGYGGSCVNDLRIRFEDKLGRGCTSSWLFNMWRVKWRTLSAVDPDDFSDGSGWNGFNYAEAGCIAQSAFDVPNRVKKLNHSKSHKSQRK